MTKTKILILFSLCLYIIPVSFTQAGNCSTSGDIKLCDNVTTYIDTQGNEFQMGTITFSDGKNEITILDRNLGAKSNDISKEESKGYYFQRGNNYGFSNVGDLKTSNNKVNASKYNRNNPYVSDTYITNLELYSTYNKNLRGGGEDNKDNDYGMNANNRYMRQGPCPAGYHVPSEGEINKLFTLWYNKENGGDKDIHNINIFRMDESVDIINNFHFPPSGGRRYIDASLYLLGGRSCLWTSTPNEVKNAFIVEGDNYAISSQRLSEKSWGSNIRCFKDEYEGNVKIITLNYETNGGTKVQSQTLLKGSNGYLPGYTISKEGYKLEGRYFDKSFNHPFDPNEELDTDTTLYAKREEYIEEPITGKFIGNIWISGTGSEYDLAYEFAYKSNLTNASNINDARMNGKLTRAAMSKILTQYAINILGKVPDKTKQCQFADVDNKLDAQFSNGITLACQLGIMGVGNKNFRPYDNVTRAEFATVLSRLLYNTSDGSKHYYSTHLLKLYNEGIITNMDPKLEEKRGYVMIMLMRTAENNTGGYTNNNDNDDNNDNNGNNSDIEGSEFVKLTDAEIQEYYRNNCACPKGYSYTPEWVTYADPGCEAEICEDDGRNCVLYVTSFNNSCNKKVDIEEVNSRIPMGSKEVENYYKENCQCPIGFEFVKKTADRYADSCDRKYCVDNECKEIETWHIWVNGLCTTNL